MTVGVYRSNSDVRIERIPIPQIGSNEILMKVMASGICGSDLMEFHRKPKAGPNGSILGHEVSGEVVEVGNNIAGKYGVGDRIFVTHHVPCGECRSCRRGHGTRCDGFRLINNFEPGGFSQYIKVSGRSLDVGVIHLDDSVSYDQASFIEPLGTVVESEEKYKHNETVLIIGGGVAGILNAQMAGMNGAGKVIVTDINRDRWENACDFSDYAMNAKLFNPDLLKKINHGRLADKVIICSGAPEVTKQAFESFGDGGSVLFFTTPPKDVTINMDWYKNWRSLERVNMTYGATPESNQKAYELIRDGKIDVDSMISHRLPLEDLADAFKMASKGEGLKYIIHPNGDC
ncbi:alcohol dehydrogenase catalytic domain-containing protein [Candidatus Pacearchaeota archaeon]|nr:alcohol dehydrogenase catalytic domain-containing protein [Candidatus Pacearchaeota archaeon]